MHIVQFNRVCKSDFYKTPNKKRYFNKYLCKKDQKYDILRVNTTAGGNIIMRAPVRQLNTNDITSEVYTIAPTQIDYIARLLGDGVADAMNMRAFSGKIREIAAQSLQTALSRARHMGENN
jgi:hypothetical protein